VDRPITPACDNEVDSRSHSIARKLGRVMRPNRSLELHLIAMAAKPRLQFVNKEFVRRIPRGWVVDANATHQIKLRFKLCGRVIRNRTQEAQSGHKKHKKDLVLRIFVLLVL
jgi:hypothetical protein